MKEIYIIRHGETEWNVLKKAQGAEADIPLNDNGRSQAMKTGQYLNKYRLKTVGPRGGVYKKQFDCVFTSPLIRAKETCEIICDEIGYTGKINVFKELIEHRRGKISGGNKKEDKLYREYFDKFEEILDSIEDPIEKYMWYEKGDDILSDMLDLGIEPSEESEKRAEEFVHKVKNMKCSKILIVSHSGFIYKHLIPAMIGIPGRMVEKQPDFLQPNGSNCSITYIKYDESKDDFQMMIPPNTLHLGL